ncbi:MAG: 2'-5' RNA ligase family protein [Patescibacteria group bacterium]|nr:2'-5' RNA ligase family protein [Patescibacteria group bacterium]
MKTLININLPELTDILNPWREETIELSHKGVPPHVSLIYPWLETPISKKELKNIQKILENTKIFTLEFDSIKKFDNGTTYFSPSNTKKLQEIQNKIMKKYPTIKMYNGEFKDTIFHLTIAKIGDDEEKFVEIQNKLSKYLPIKKEITQITIMQEDENGYWSDYTTINLK